ncbi:MAG: fibronectin type III domain-containing protein, partial [Thermoguttaceae bacterium]
FANSSQGDYTLAAGSVAINIGVDSAAVNVLGERLSQDLEGQKRLVATVDAGAYEYQGVAPSSPSNLSISDYFISNGKPSLTWGAPISPDGMDGYYVYLIAGNDRKLLTTVNSSLNKIYDLSEFVDFEVNSEYTFGVSAFNQFGESSISKISYVTSVAPTAPTNLIFGSYKNGSATISWTGSEYASSYRVETLESDGTWSVIGNTSENHYSVSGLSDFESYTFRITAVNVAGSASSDPLTFVTTTSPSSPENVSWASSYQGDGLATLTWEAVDHADGYVVRQKIDGDWIEVGVTTNPSYSFSGLENGSQYEYSVAAFARSTSGELFYSEAVEIGLVTIVAPSAPSNLSWTTDYLNGSITLAWNAVDSVSGYSVAQFVDGKWVEIASTTSLSYLFNSLTDNSVYSFGVAAYNMSGDTRLASDYTSIALNTAVVPAPPTNLHFESYGGGSSATLMWNSVTNASGYLIEMLDSSNQWVTVDTTTSTKYVLTVEENSFYTFRVSAYTTVGSVTKYSA